VRRFCLVILSYSSKAELKIDWMLEEIDGVGRTWDMGIVGGKIVSQ
jgi:hypothetical protein